MLVTHLTSPRFPDTTQQYSWPPKDPTIFRPHQDFTGEDDDEPPENSFNLPSSPWTFDNGSLNPNLQPSNTYRRRAFKSNRTYAEQNEAQGSNEPTYPPNNAEPSATASDGNVRDGHYDDGSSEYSLDEDELYQESRPWIRRGSEGYEVKPIDREEILRRYILSRGEEAGYYQRYVPEPEPEGEDNQDQEDEYEDIIEDGEYPVHPGANEYPVDAEDVRDDEPLLAQ